MKGRKRMNYSVIRELDIANGPGCRTTLFVSGCRNHCPGCFQPETWAFDYGKPFDEKAEDFILDTLKPDYVEGLTLLGGDPFELENQRALLPFLRRVREAYGKKKDLWAYTGYVYERDLCPGGARYTEDTDPLLDLLDVCVDGPFVLEKKDIRLRFRGSSNQRILDLREIRKRQKAPV